MGDVARTESAGDAGDEALSSLAADAFSKGRLAILRAISAGPMRYTDIAAKVGGSESETSRHLNRLLDAGLTVKDAHGRFSATPLVSSVFAVSRPLRSLASRSAFFTRHELGGLPPSFLFRLGETDDATLATDPLQVMRAAESVMGGVSTFFFGQWVLGKPTLSDGELMMQRLLRERVVAHQADARGILLPGEVGALRDAIPGIASYFAVRTMDRAPVALAISDGGAVLQLPDATGRIDFQQALVGRNPAFVGWCRELFLDAWGRSAALDA